MFVGIRAVMIGFSWFCDLYELVMMVTCSRNISCLVLGKRFVILILFKDVGSERMMFVLESSLKSVVTYCKTFGWIQLLHIST